MFMKPILRLTLLLTLTILLFVPSSVLAQDYLFSLDQLDVNVYYNEDGTATIDYIFTFRNQPQGHAIEYVDVGVPNGSFSTSGIEAFIEGKPITDISRGDYEGSGTGFAVALGSDAIQPGQTGRVRVVIPNVERVLYPDDEDNNYASAVFSPTWFGSQYVVDSTNITVTFHLPPGVQPDEPKWHAAPDGFPATPETGIDDQGRVTYTWKNPSGYAYNQYFFGASFPKDYVPASAIITPGFFERLGIDPESIISCLFCSGFVGFFVFSTFWSVRSSRKRKLQYLPPKVSIEGHGIKRGLTAVEAAILLEQPMDKILTMILFGVIKKNAASVITNDPLEIQVHSPLPESLRTYETNFLDAFKEKDKKKRQKALQSMMIDLVKSVSKKMKGFSRKETVNYYKDITKRAWAQVEASETPEVKSEKYDKVMEWTMLDRDYERRTRDIFQSGPVYAPIWWPRYSPSYRPVASSGSRPSVPTISGSGKGGGGVSLPTLPGAAFAASVVNGTQNLSASVIGNVSDFTSGVTNRTNPVPVSKSSGSFSSGGGGGCACACACAGCACACAGGGR
jgi:hypothetical protein